MEKEDLKEDFKEKEFTQDQLDYVYQDRRYVGTKEIVGYVMWDMAQSFNINTYSDRFVNTVLQVSFKYQQILSVINGIWDVVNDIFTAAIVDKTRTRWGKFKPYLIVLAVPGTIGTCLYWLMPLFFKGTSPDDLNKFFFYALLAIVREGAGTFRGIAQGGLMTTITPHPVERTRLITIANYFSGMLGEKLPEQIMTILLDLIGNGIIKPKKVTISTMYTRLFVGMGVFTSVVAGAATLWFNLIVKERVPQSVERPSIMQGVKSILNNKPVLLLTLSQILSSFSVGGSKSDYFIEVLNFATLGFFTGIPAGLMGPTGYLLVPWFRRHFQSRTLYLIGTYVGDVLLVPVFLIGSIGGKKHGLYKNKWVIGICLAVWEVIFTLFYGVRKVIPTEMYNEAMDYCEWKNGYRTEAMTSVAKGLAAKLASIYTRVIQLQIKRWIGYDQTAYIKGAKQTDHTKYWLFAAFSIFPFATGFIGMIPMFFYDLSGKKREQMYAELLDRRANISKTASSGDAETMARVAAEQMEVGKKNKDRKL
ncbi:MAG TPA: MFS transporter [Clostridiales bacterium]|nr:MFS transporter [Clostridiales bacterium]